MTPTPSSDYRRVSFHRPDKLCKGIDVVANHWIGVYQRRATILRTLRADAERVDAMAPQFRDLSDRELRERLRGFRETFLRGGKRAEAVTLEALGAIREAAVRQVGLRPFVVQLMGALALHRGYLAEMATGEGKTLTAGLAAVLSGWDHRPCHVVTVNDYLAQRDAEWLRPLYEFSAVRVGCVTAAMNPDERRKAYNADVTYTTSKEVVADFLRDRLRLGSVPDPARRLIRKMVSPAFSAQEGLVMRGLHAAIVDEADSVLIDEAVTPLIISTMRKNEALREVVSLAREIVEPLVPGVDYELNTRYREVELTPVGREKLDARCASLPGLWRGHSRRTELVKQALVAREFYQPGKQYVVQDGKVVIVDEFTGRPMPQRTWRQGMHQAIEAKEQINISDPTETVARLSFQRYFRFYKRLSGMTGTAREADSEFWQIYGLAVVTIPTNKPCIRQELPDRVFPDEASKWEAVADEVARVHGTGRPLLIGTRSVAASERLAALLDQRNMTYRLLNAVRHQEEAQIIAEAGGAGRVTIATNMAGRGTDIKLEKGVAELGGLHVIGTERHESRRVDRQLFGRAARQGDPGSAQAFISAEDELLRRFVSGPIRRKLAQMVAANTPGARPLARLVFAKAQRSAQKQAFQQRKSVLKMDDWMEEALSFTGPELF
jgi:preprotein translocase subunit SecA